MQLTEMLVHAAAEIVTALCGDFGQCWAEECNNEVAVQHGTVASGFMHAYEVEVKDSSVYLAELSVKAQYLVVAPSVMVTVRAFTWHQGGSGAHPCLYRPVYAWIVYCVVCATGTCCSDLGRTWHRQVGVYLDKQRRPLWSPSVPVLGIMEGQVYTPCPYRPVYAWIVICVVCATGMRCSDLGRAWHRQVGVYMDNANVASVVSHLMPMMEP